MLNIVPQPELNNTVRKKIIDIEEALEDHESLLARYVRSHRIRNHSAQTIKKEKAFLDSWFKEYGDKHRPLFTWEAMEPVIGRKRIINYGNTLIDTELSVSTVRSYLGILSRYFSYILEFPYITNNDISKKIYAKYGEIAQPVSEFDKPKHSYDGEKLGIPFDPEKLYQFFSVIRKYYIGSSSYSIINSRNYAMVILAGESGLRVDELLHLELGDLFFDSNKLQTRFAKGTKGSGKRARVTLFPALSRDTMRYYLKKIRPILLKGKKSELVFLSKKGNLLDYSSANKALNQIINIANKHDFHIANHMSFHWLRRLFATRFIERFPNQLSLLVQLLGHQTPGTVHCYIRHSEAWMDKQIKKMLEGAKSWPSIGV